MQINISHEKGSVPVAVVKMAGQLDGQTYQDLIKAAQDLMNAGTQNILLDMSELTFVSSAGLVSLHVTALLMRGEAMPDLEHGWAALRSISSSRESGMQKHVKLLNPRSEIMNTLDMVGFSTLFEVFTDKQKAIDSFS
jgi:anti-anti-sigma regulatory factor